jgi:predicted lipoprotein
MRRLLPILSLFAVAGVLCWVFPPFRVHSLKAVREAQAGAQFNAADFVSTFWTEKLLPSAEQAPDAAIVLDKIDSNPNSAREQFGRTVGVSRSYFLFLRGEGRVVSADEFEIGLSLKADDDEAQIVIKLDFVFGSAIRDATGLISPSSYPNAQEFNEISAALNSRVETNVLPRLQQIAKMGGRIRFVGCVEIGDEEMDLKPLRLVPILVEEARD